MPSLLACKSRSFFLLSSLVAEFGPLALHPQDVSVEEKVGEGQFGFVHRGKLLKPVLSIVAIKFLKETAEFQEQELFVREALRMKDLKHENVVSLIGVQYQRKPIFIVLEYLGKGDLRKYLLGGRGLLNIPTQVDMCVQVMSGLHYLQSMHYVHRDIAARNVLINEKDVLKVSDFGLSRSLYVSQGQYKKSGGMLPLRWMVFTQ